MQRRGLLIGFTGLLVTPAIVRAQSLMRISVLGQDKDVRFKLTVFHEAGGTSTILGETSLSRINDRQALIDYISGTVPWGLFNFTGTSTDRLWVSILRDGQPALDCQHGFVTNGRRLNYYG